ncbi:hypothetical protein DFJ74DRAFT_653531 [Hyaloraphidium curvatum]|nr:hypothetical protein DFJ74DRAFT_653531 [Hyaloraphidium curvatum]
MAAVPPRFDDSFEAADLSPEELGSWSTSGHSWSELAEIITSGDYNRLVRNEDVARRYALWARWCRQEYRTVEDYIKIDVFGYAGSMDDCGRFVALPPLPSAATAQPVLRRNNFPYFVPPEATHWVVWSTRHLQLAETLDILKHHFPPEGFELLLFENPSPRRTVPGVFHVHAISRERILDDNPYSQWSPNMGKSEWALQ